jgi:TRAP-type C4-dicarboxylate transport system permease small subunit
VRAVLRHAEEALSVGFGVVLFGVLIWQVVTRYLLDDPSIWTEECARYLYVGVVFFGAAAAVSERSHIGMPFIVERLPTGLRLVTGLLTQALSVMFCIAVVIWGSRAAWREMDLPSVAMEFPMGLVLALVPIAMACAGIRILLNMAEDIRDARAGRLRAATTASDF